jgi:hypothetical protein
MSVTTTTDHTIFDRPAQVMVELDDKGSGVPARPQLSAARFIESPADLSVARAIDWPLKYE